MEPSLAPGALARWARARRYAVPPTMIEAATERRLAGDWRGACAAANVDVEVDPDDPALAEIRGQLPADLAVLAPDLMRWHLPLRWGRETLVSNQTVVLATYRATAGKWRRRRRIALYVRTSRANGPQRLKLNCAPVEDEAVMNWSDRRHLWDANHADRLRVRCGGSADRAPFFHADGTPLTEAELPASDPGDRDLAARTEWLAIQLQRGQTAEVLAATGINPKVTSPQRRRWYGGFDREELAGWTRSHLAVLVFLAETFRQHRGIPLDHLGAALFVVDYFQVVRQAGCAGTRLLPLPPLCQLPDIDLLLSGRLTPHDLHPLVRSSLFPKLPSEPRSEYELKPVWIRCRDEWHQVEHRDGLLTGPHTEEEHSREHALSALGGPVTGCFKARQDWLEGNRLPRYLRAQRSELFSRIRHGDTPGVVALLDAGLDPRVRDGLRRNLLHYLHFVDHESLLDRLLAAGVDVNAVDYSGRTPLHVAIVKGGSPESVRVLLAAGARIDAVDNVHFGVADLIEQTKRADLPFLVDELARRRGEIDGH